MENKALPTLGQVVASVKLIARDALRSKLISARLSKISEIEAEIKSNDSLITDSETRLAEAKKNVKRAEYRKSKIDPNDPDAEDITKYADEDVKLGNDNVTKAEKNLEQVKVNVKEANEILKKKIEEHNEGIKKIEAGETKVSREELNELVDKLLVEKARNLV